MSAKPFSQAFLALSRTQPSVFSSSLAFTLENGTRVIAHGPGVIEFLPANQQWVKTNPKAIVYSCGVHGNETAPIEICDHLVEDLLAEKMPLSHPLLVIFGNLKAMDIGERFVEENMNRLFCGEHANPDVPSNAERQRAAFLEQCVAAFFDQFEPDIARYHYDLHTAIRRSKNEKFAVYPFLHGKAHSKRQLAIMADCGVKTILLSQAPTTTFSYHSSVTHSAHAFTVELGQVRPFGQNDMTKFAQAQQVLRALVSEPHYMPDVRLEEMLLYSVNQVINKHEDNFTLHFADEEANFSDYAKGTLLASEGEKQYVTQYDGEAIVFPNANVAKGQRALLTVIPVALDSLELTEDL